MEALVEFLGKGFMVMLMISMPCVLVAALVGLVYFDAEKMEQDGINVEAYGKELMTQVNLQMPVYSKLSGVEKMDSPFEKTPKMSIKRFLYS